MKPGTYFKPCELMRKAEEHEMDCANKKKSTVLNMTRSQFYNFVLEFDEDLHIECHKRRGIDTCSELKLSFYKL